MNIYRYKFELILIIHLMFRKLSMKSIIRQIDLRLIKFNVMVDLIFARATLNFLI